MEGSSEIIAVTQAFNKMSQGIKQLETDRVIMTAGITHDLRTPLTRIRLASEMLPDEQDWVKDGIEHDVEDLNSIIDQFIDYSRQDQQETMEYTQLNNLLLDSVEARKNLTKHKISLELGKIPLTQLRANGIKRVIENLIENAFKYGSDEIVISTTLINKKRHIFCVIRDFGPGISDNHLSSMFTPFTQGDHARGSSGSGLGLAIAKRIVESHEGKMDFTNHPEGGLCAGFTIPVKYSSATRK